MGMRPGLAELLCSVMLWLIHETVFSSIAKIIMLLGLITLLIRSDQLWTHEQSDQLTTSFRFTNIIDEESEVGEREE